MRPSEPLARLVQLRTRQRRRAGAEHAEAVARVAALDREVARGQAAESAARSVAPGDHATAALLGASEYADAVARGLTALGDDRVRAIAAVVAARDELRARRRREEQLGRLSARRGARAAARAAHAHDRLLDELALRAHGRRR
jgi:flagellar export protein FliJ